MRTLTYETYPPYGYKDSDSTVRVFSVDEAWASKWLMDNPTEEMEERKEFSVAVFDASYTWDDTCAMYEDAYKAGALVCEDVRPESEW